jgi:hypothetical protein
MGWNRANVGSARQPHFAFTCRVGALHHSFSTVTSILRVSRVPRLPSPKLEHCTEHPQTCDCRFLARPRLSTPSTIQFRQVQSINRNQRNNNLPMAPPTGPRAGTSNRTSLRPTRGGGVGKRRGIPRTDRDGDVSMDSVLAGNPPTGPSGQPSRGSRGARGGRGRGGRGGGPTRASSRLAQNVRNYVSEQDGTTRSTKGQPKVSIKILGLKDSKAANNPDGGLRSLLDFLERKASKERQITLGRVRHSVAIPICL